MFSYSPTGKKKYSRVRADGNQLNLIITTQCKPVGKQGIHSAKQKKNNTEKRKK